MDTGAISSGGREVFTQKESFLSLVNLIAGNLANGNHEQSELIAMMGVHAADTIFKFSESPIETSLWTSAFAASLKCGNLIEFWAPPPADVDFTEARRDKCLWIDGICTCYLIYLSHPDRNNLTFGEFARWKEPDRPDEELKQWEVYAFMAFQAGTMFRPTVVLNPSMRLAGRTIRPDGVCFVPAYPDNCVIFECDGFEFHSSRESFTQDRERDRLISADLGIEVRRYSGHEIYRNPLDCGMDVAHFLQAKLGNSAKLKKKWMSRKTALIRRETAKAALGAD